MQITDYVSAILEVISSCPFIESQNLSFEERPPNAAFITGTIAFTNNSKLHFKEFVVFKPEGINIVKYGYSYLDKKSALIFRYDNALDPKTKKLSTYPEHKHASKELMSAKRPALKEVLDEIANQIEELSDLKAIDDRINEPAESYEAYSQKRTSIKRYLDR
ncbi:MAG: hypothetical protein HZA16_01465 [Nitrospirae bacterium]|nr:hypothetical protein [Nitrospirota bacterium]